MQLISAARWFSSRQAHAAVVACAVMFTSAGALAKQARRGAKPRTPPPPALTVAPAKVKCPELLGTGVRTGATYCFVLAGRDPASGVLVTVPPHAGEATLSFDLHNRHTYSEEEMRAGRNFAKYSAVIGVLTMDGTLLERGAVQTEFRGVGDLYERISGGAGPGGVKAVAPLGREQVTIKVPAGINEVSLLGEVLEGITAAGRETTAAGRPVGLVSNIRLEYRPARGKAPARPKR